MASAVERTANSLSAIACFCVANKPTIDYLALRNAACRMGRVVVQGDSYTCDGTRGWESVCLPASALVLARY